MIKLPVVLGSVVGLMALYVTAMSVKLSMTTDELESLVLPHINDASTAKFAAPLIAVNNQSACMDWQAKNKSGGYVSPKTASFRNSDSGWILNDLDSSGCVEVLKTSNTKI